MDLLTLVTLFCLTANFVVSGTYEIRNTNDELFKQLDQRSDDDRPPIIDDDPVVVEIDLYMKGLSDVTSTSMQYRIDVFLTQRWNDSRLIFNQNTSKFISLPDRLVPRLWIPDLFISQAKNGKIHSITAESKVIKLRPSDGTLLSSQRIQAEISCAMDLVYFPFDSQQCEMRLESWRYDSDFIELKWLPGSFNNDYNNKEVDDRLSKALPALSVDTYALREGKCIDTARPNFSCLNYYIAFHRKLSYYVGDIYIPSLLMVIVTWMSFWIDRKVIQGRCALGALTMVAISNQINSVKLTLPPTAQVKAADVWLWTCQFYVLAAFLQFGLVNYVSRRDQEKKAKLEKAAASISDQSNGQPQPISTSNGSGVASTANEEGGYRSQVAEELSHDGVAIELNTLSNQPANDREHVAERVRAIDICSSKFQQWWEIWKSLDNSTKVDVFSRVFFPASFALFTLIYWAHYARVSGYRSTRF